MFQKRYTFIIVIIYALIGALWILFSDKVLSKYVQDIELYAQLQTYKGWLYIASTATLLYILIRAYVVRLEKYESELRKQRDYNRLLFTKSSIGLALCRMDGTLIDVNEAYAKIIGRTVEETLKLTYWDITPDKYKEEELRILELLKNKGRYGPYEKHYIHKDGHLVPVRLQGTLIKIDGEEYIWSSVEDITELKKAEKALIESEKKYREIVDNAVSIILRMSLDGEVKFINKYGEEFFGFTSDELIGRNVVGTIVPERETTGRDLKELMDKILKYPEKFEYNINENIKKNGERVWIFWVNKAIYDEQGQVKEILSIGTDITELKRAQEELEKYKEHLEELVRERTKELEEANEKLKELDRLKSMFIASMSHELRTPLNSIIGFSSIILNEWLGPLNEEQKINIATIHRSGKHLLALINDVIDISKIEAGVIDIIPEEFELSDLLKEAIENFEKDIVQKGLEFSIEILPVKMNTDRRRVFQCVTNLLSNAVKFTENGYIKLTSSEDEKDADFVQITIEDSGIGIKEEDLRRLFQPFQRFDSPNKGKIPGTGLGLYITKKIVTEVLKGDIIVESKYGKGSKFIIRIPKRLIKK